MVRMAWNLCWENETVRKGRELGLRGGVGFEQDKEGRGRGLVEEGTGWEEE